MGVFPSPVFDRGYRTSTGSRATPSFIEGVQICTAVGQPLFIPAEESFLRAPPDTFIREVRCWQLFVGLGASTVPYQRKWVTGGVVSALLGYDPEVR